MRGSIRGCVIKAITVVSVLASLLGSAQAEEPEALIRQGIELRRRGNDARAHGYFKRAYELSKTPRTAAQLGLVDQAVGRFTEGEMLLSDALGTGDPWVQQHRPALEKSLKALRRHLGNVLVQGAPPGTKWSDADHPEAPLPSSGSIWVSPGEGALHFEAAGRLAATLDVKVAVGESVTVTVDLPVVKPPAPPAVSAVSVPESGHTTDAVPTNPTPPAHPPAPGKETAPPPPEAASDGLAWRITGIVVAATGVAVGVTGFYMRTVATNKLNAIMTQASSNTKAPYDSSNGNWQTYEHAGVGMLIAGGAAIVAGSAMYLINWPGHADEGETKVGLLALPDLHGGGSLQVQARF